MRGWRLFVLGRVSKGIAGVTDRAAGQLPTVPLPGSSPCEWSLPVMFAGAHQTGTCNKPCQHVQEVTLLALAPCQGHFLSEGLT